MIFSKKKILTDDFSLYIHRPTATDESFAPKGCDSFYVLCPVPNLQGSINWDNESEKLKDRIIAELSKTILPKLEETITDVFWMNPKDFKNDYNSMHGAGFSIAPIFTQSAWFRYHNKDKKIKNLYFSAAGSHPGAGIPGVLSSAKVVENIIRSELKMMRNIDLNSTKTLKKKVKVFIGQAFFYLKIQKKMLVFSIQFADILMT